MAGMVFNGANAGNVSGRVCCYEYVNEDAPAEWQSMACGQAAAATAVATLQGLQPVGFNQLFSAPWNPDAGWAGAGSTPNRVRSIIRSFFCKQVYKINGIAELKQCLDKNYPVVVLLDNSAMGCGNKWCTLHWVCAYGYSPWNIFLSNLWYPGYGSDAEAATGGANVCPWGAFEKGWNSWVTKGLGMGASAFLVY